MTNIWDEKPRYTLDQTYGSIYVAHKMDAWLKRVEPLVYAGEQAVKWGYVEIHKGDPVTYTVHCGLKERAEKFDKYLESIKDSVPHVSLTDYEILEDKLEAIKNWLEKYALRLSDRPYDSLKKILGDEE